MLGGAGGIILGLAVYYAIIRLMIPLPTGVPLSAEHLLVAIGGFPLAVIGGGVLGASLAAGYPTPTSNGGKQTKEREQLRKAQGLCLLGYLVWGFFVLRVYFTQSTEIDVYVVNGTEGSIAVDADSQRITTVKENGWTLVQLKKTAAFLKISHLEIGQAPSEFRVANPGVYILNIGPKYTVDYCPVTYTKGGKVGVVEGMLESEWSFTGSPDIDGEGLLLLEHVRTSMTNSGEILDFDTPVPETIVASNSGPVTRWRLSRIISPNYERLRQRSAGIAREAAAAVAMGASPSHTPAIAIAGMLSHS